MSLGNRKLRKLPSVLALKAFAASVGDRPEICCVASVGSTRLCLCQKIPKSRSKADVAKIETLPRFNTTKVATKLHHSFSVFTLTWAIYSDTRTGTTAEMFGKEKILGRSDVTKFDSVVVSVVAVLQGTVVWTVLEDRKIVADCQAARLWSTAI